MMRSMSPKSSDRSRDEPDASAKPPSKSKLVKRTHKALVKALESHVTIVTGSGVSLKKAQRAGAKVAAAAAAYADAVQAKTGLDNPFTPGNGMLDVATIASLRAEQSKLKAQTASIPIIAREDSAPPSA
jgi:nucleoside phosphorylase